MEGEAIKSLMEMMQTTMKQSQDQISGVLNNVKAQPVRLKSGSEVDLNGLRFKEVIEGGVRLHYIDGYKLELKCEPEEVNLLKKK